MILSLRAFFLSRALREKLLLVAFIGIAAAWWLSAFNTRLSAFWREQRMTTTRLTTQEQWIKNKTVIEQTAQKTAGLLEPSRTLNANQLVTTVAQLANEAGLRNVGTSGNAVTRQSGQFAIHSVEYTIRNAEWDALRKFYEALQKRAPYISIERFTLSAPPTNPGQHVLGLRVVSVEILR